LVQWSIRFNGVVTAILRSPFHWLLSYGLMLITVTGRKSGRVYTIPVGYHRMDDAVVILVGEAPAKKWWRNYREPGPVELLLRGRRRRGVAEVVPPETAEFRARVEASLRRAPFMERVLGVDFDRQSGLSDGQVRTLAERMAVVRVRLAS
jgi:deazaflavin-dependent oxidoreductase (nitroreductase family)